MKYWYEYEANIGGWARVNLGEMQQDAAGQPVKGPCICAADTGSGYVGKGDSETQRHAPELAEEVVGLVRLMEKQRFDAAPEGRAHTEAELSRCVQKIVESLRYRDLALPDRTATASVGGTVKPDKSIATKNAETLRVGKHYPAPNWALEAKEQNRKKAEAGVAER